MTQSIEIARAILAGFDRHYGLFRQAAWRAKQCFEAGDFHRIRQLQRERIDFYALRVQEALQRLESEFRAGELSNAIWQLIKRDYVAMLDGHRQPELAETFFNSVVCRILHRDYFNNDFIFLRPAVATDYLDSEPPCYRAYYPPLQSLVTRPPDAAAAMSVAQAQQRAVLLVIRAALVDFGLACAWEDIDRDVLRVIDAARAHWRATRPKPFDAQPDCQIHVLRSLFFRNKGAYVIGRLLNNGELFPFALPILQNRRGQIFIDAAIFEPEQIELLFSFARAYFMVDMEVPSAWVQFLRTLIPNKPKSELYTMLGLQKQGKTLFYRDYLHHLRHSTDAFVKAPGIEGLVMAVFTLPSFPYVFKVIKDKRGKDTSAEHVRDRYQLVKTHDRVGRMADTWEYSDVPFPRERIDPALLEQLRQVAPSMLDERADVLMVRHLYIERRMEPLNIFLQKAKASGAQSQLDHAIREYGNAIKDLVAANIFPGDMLYKNFGMTRQGRVIFYDYDEIVYLTDCHFRRIPPAPTPEDEMAAEPWYAVGPHDVFPEEFGRFLLGDAGLRRRFMAEHADLLDAEFWQRKQARIRAGMLEDVFPYPESLRFDRRGTVPTQGAPL
jgi:isocitrate dehydrogenase kinase/phosphatase